MNTLDDKTHRLLNLFPGETIKSNWPNSKQNKKADLIDWVVANEHRDAILDFVKENMGLTRQHVHIFSLTANCPSPKELIDGECLSTPTEIRRGNYYYLVDLQYRVFVMENGTGSEQDLHFEWPIHIYRRGDHLIVRFTLMEKKVSAYFPKPQRGFFISRNGEEESIIGEIRSSFSPAGTLLTEDLNTGVKALWASDIIDSTQTSFKSAISTDSVAMDGSYLVKKDFPTRYNELLLAPLFKTTFKTMAVNGTALPEYFWVDPSFGLVGFPIFSSDTGAVENVIGEILTRN